MTGVPDELAGFRTLFSAFHHFRPEQARAILGDAVRKHHGIAVFEGTYHSALAMFLMLLVPLMVLLVTPFIRSFRWSRLVWTYLIPVVPLVSLFDGLVSCLRTYSVEELRQLAEDLGANNYQWDFGELKGKGPLPITYLIGVPIEKPLERIRRKVEPGSAMDSQAGEAVACNDLYTLTQPSPRDQRR